jgi:hypothetical protein
LAAAWSIDTILKALIITALVVEGIGGAVLLRQRLLQRNVSTPTLTAPLPSPISNPNLNLNPGPSVMTTATPTLAPPKAHFQLPDLVSIFDAVSRALEGGGGP